MMYYYNDFLPFSFIEHIAVLIFWVLIIMLIIQALRRRSFVHSSNNNALEILKERYAKGEIHKEEFEAMKKDLQ